jgi:DNA-binding transcriptional LysR family regulator
MDKLLAMTTFVRIVDTGSLTAAAKALDTSLPSVVRLLAGLEHHLDARLLNRTTRRIHLTDEGAQYLVHCRAVLAAVRDAEVALASGHAEPHGRLAVTASVLFGRRYVAPIAIAFMRAYPKVSADLLFVDRVVNIVEEGLDVAVRIGPLSDSSLVAVSIGQVRRVVCASPQYLRRHGVPRSPAEIRKHSCIRHSGLSPRNEWRFHIGRRIVTIPFVSVMTCNEIDSSIAACAKGLGLGMFLSYQVAPERGSGKLRYVLEEFETEPLPIHVVYPHSKLLSTTVRTFVDASVKELRQAKYD